MEFYNDYNRPDVFSLAANPEHALHSPDVLLMTSSQNMFMYEQEYDAPSSKQDAFSAEPAENVFEFPNPEEMAELGCSPLVDSCWPETPLLAGSLDGSLNDSALSFSWDLEDGEEESIFQHGNNEFHTAPTLAELNLEDSESTDNSMSLKRKHSVGENDDPNVPRVTDVLNVKQERSLSPQSWKHVARSMAVEAAGGELATSKTNGHKRASVKRTSRARPNRPLASRNDRSQSNNMSSTMSARTSNTAKISQGKTEVSKLDFSQLFFKRRKDLTPSPSKDMTRSELIATTPNPFGNRRFLGRNALLATKKNHHSHHQHQHQKVNPSRPRTHNRSILHRNIPKTRTSRRTPIKKEKSLISVAKRDDISEEKLWNELKQFMYSGSKEVKKETVTVDSEAKSESSKSSLSHTTSDPGFDSHDEGLGSEHEDHDDFGSEEEEEEEEEDDMEDDASDISDDPGLPSTSSKTTEATVGDRLSSGPVPPKKRRFKTRRSEYDDFTPNPRKLLQIGHELNKLNLTISELTPGNDVSMDERNNTRREKNKLASRACRLKKKAQHEANKVKLWGLNEEAKQLQSVLASMRQEIGARIDNPKACWDYSLGAKMDHLIKTSLGHMVAGHTSEFVNSVLEKTAKGVPLASLKLPAIKV